MHCALEWSSSPLELMPIHREHRLLFIHIPKTGGTSVEEVLEIRGAWQEENLDACFGLIQSLSLLRFGFGTNFLQHLTFLELSVFLGDGLQGLTPFAVLRDPWTRLLSSFRRKDPDLCELYRYKCHGDLHELGLEEYVEVASWLDHPHLRPQWKFLCSSSESVPDPRIRLFRQEQMADLELWLSQRLGTTIQLSSSNVRVPASPLPDMTPTQLKALKERVNALYAQDVDLLSRCCPLGTPESLGL